MRTYRRILQAAYSAPWAILPSKLQDIMAFLHSKEGQEAISKAIKRGELDCLTSRSMAGAIAHPMAGPIQKHSTDTSDAGWDGPANERRVRSGEDKAYYHKIYAWEDDEGDPEVKATYKFIHHEVDGEGKPGAANIRACQTGIGVLNGARGGTTIPQGDKRGVYNHLAAHLEDAGVEPPEFKGSAFKHEAAAIPMRRSQEHPGVNVVGSVAIVPVLGTLSYRVNMMRSISDPGGTSVNLLSNQLQNLADDPAISSIILDIDSPGGMVSGIPELGDTIRDIRQKKRIVAVANDFAASAAYWIAASASELVVTPSGQVGSIGVFVLHQDESAAWEQMGVKNTFISAGKFKTEGNSFQPLSDEARANMQDTVDEYYDMFIRAVASGRKASQAKVRETFGQGRMVLAKRALELGMVDRISTMDQTVARALRAAAAGRNGSGPKTLREFEAFLREEGRFSHTEARRIACYGFGKPDPRDEGSDDVSDPDELARALMGLRDTLTGNK